MPEPTVRDATPLLVVVAPSASGRGPDVADVPWR